MSRFLSTLEGAGGLDIIREVYIGTEKYLLFTRYAESQWQIGASDGLEIWVVELNERDVKEYSGRQDEKSFLTSLCHGLCDGEVQLLKSHNQLILCVKASSELEFSLFECSVAKKKVEMKILLFRLWDRLQTSEEKLTKCEGELADAQKHRASEPSAFTEVTTRSAGAKAAANRPKKIAGASLVNPSAKRRKKATGVVFGEDED